MPKTAKRQRLPDLAEIEALLPRDLPKRRFAASLPLALVFERPHHGEDDMDGVRRLTRSKKLHEATDQLQKLRRAIDACKEELAWDRVRVDEGAWTNPFAEAIGQLDVIALFLQKAEWDLPPDRDEAWQLATRIRSTLEICDVPIGKTLSGTWARCVKFALPWLYPQSGPDELDAKLASLKRQWDRDKARGVTTFLKKHGKVVI